MWGEKIDNVHGKGESFIVGSVKTVSLKWKSVLFALSLFFFFFHTAMGNNYFSVSLVLPE